MSMITGIFRYVLGMSLTAAYCILAVCLLRFALRKMPKRFSYLLWLAVAFRLVCPMVPESSFSLMGDRVAECAGRITAQKARDEWAEKTLTEEKTMEGYSVKEHSTEDLSAEGHPMEGYSVGELSAEEHPMKEFSMEDSLTGKASATEDPLAMGIQPEKKDAGGASEGVFIGAAASGTLTGPYNLAAGVWFGVFLLLFGCNIFRYTRLQRRLKAASYPGPAYEKIPVKYVPGIGTPFVLGLARPVIYLPEGLTGEERAQCLPHERVHVRRGDYLVKHFAFMLVCVHWFNPFVWLAFHLMTRDLEMSCDEQALQSTALADRKAYSGILVGMSAGKVNFGGCPLAFGESCVAARVKNIMNYKKTGLAAGALLGTGILLCLAGLSTNPKRTPNWEPVPAADTGEIGTVNETERGEAPGPEAKTIREYEKELVQILKKRLTTAYQNRIGAIGQNIRANAEAGTKTRKKLEELQTNLHNGRLPDSEETREQAAELSECIEMYTYWEAEFTSERNKLQTRLSRMDVPYTDGRDIPTEKAAAAYLNLPEHNCYLTQNFSAQQTGLELVCEDDAGLGTFAPGVDIPYVEVECTEVFWYNNGMLRLDYEDVDGTDENGYLLQGSLYLAPKDAGSDKFHLNSNYIVGNVIRGGSLKDNNAANAFELSRYLNYLYRGGQ